jgi:hypothetical protein
MVYPFVAWLTVSPGHNENGKWIYELTIRSLKRESSDFRPYLVAILLICFLATQDCQGSST